VAASGDAVIAVGGAWGTLAEIAFARALGRVVIALDGAPVVEGLRTAATPAEAVELALAGIE
jgi:predicted Rossmann-fold nucleotide-binding protein